MNPVGGFLGLESPGRGTGVYHSALALSTGRSCFRVVLEIAKPRRVHVPFYVCDALLGPLQRSGTEFRFYEIDECLEPRFCPASLEADELFVFVNYFGLLGGQARRLVARWEDRVLIDDSQAFFRLGSASCWSFNSARKFFGLPDGAYLYGPSGESGLSLPRATPPDSHLRIRQLSRDSRSFPLYRSYEKGLDDVPRLISANSERLLGSLDYSDVATTRLCNYAVLHSHLGPLNGLKLEPMGDDVPLYYPFLAPRSLHRKLIDCGVYVPYLWAEVLERDVVGFEWERKLVANLCPLPIDQRYDSSMMCMVADKVIQILR